MQVRVKAARDRDLKIGTHDRGGAGSGYGYDSESDTLSEESLEVDMMSSGNGLDKQGWPEDLPPIPASWSQQCMPSTNDDIWNSVRALFALSWFRRVWVIQEVVAAANVEIVCGRWIINWSDLHRAIEIVDRQFQSSDTEFAELKSSWDPFLSLTAQREWEARQHRWTLLMLLENFRYAESTFSRDRFFALLGMASDGNEAMFEPDYDSPLEKVVLKFARVFVRQGRGMQLLYRAGLCPQSHRFPSWIPDWTVNRPSSLQDPSERGIIFAASGPQQANIKCFPDTDELIVDGYAVDNIQSVSTSSNVEQEWKEYFEEVDTMVESADLSLLHDTREDLRWKVPIAGASYPRVAISEVVDLQQSYAALRDCITGNQKGKVVEETGDPEIGKSVSSSYAITLRRMQARLCEDLRKQSASYISVLQDTLHGWRFVVTKKGFVGVVPKLAATGDVIAVLKGGQVPFVLRESETRSGAFRLVGECYIHGMMNGEGLALQGVVEREFRLH